MISRRNLDVSETTFAADNVCHLATTAALILPFVPEEYKTILKLIIHGSLGPMHMLNHVQACQLKYFFNHRCNSLAAINLVYVLVILKKSEKNFYYYS